MTDPEVNDLPKQSEVITRDMASCMDKFSRTFEASARRWELVVTFTDGTEVHLVGGMSGGIFIDEHPRPIYDKNFGDTRTCKCGHPYYRHFDSYDEMNPVGCKYCHCEQFEEPPKPQKCPTCNGTGNVIVHGGGEHGAQSMSKARSCLVCSGEGYIIDHEENET